MSRAATSPPTPLRTAGEDQQGYSFWGRCAIYAGYIVPSLLLTLLFATLQAKYVIGVAPFFSMYLFPTAIGLLFGVLLGKIRILNFRLERTALSDALTGLPNRLCFQSHLTREIRRAERYGCRLSLILLDIDLFKKVNDTYGHQAGDEVLVELARIALSEMRESDICARWGGEEFVVLLSDTPLDGATVAAERLRKAIAERRFSVAGTLTCSFGVSELRPEDSDTTLVARADKALYQAKESGRNRVVPEEPARSHEVRDHAR
jgi:diguanylate cyclase (GGDEF)-like protein